MASAVQRFAQESSRRHGLEDVGPYRAGMAMTKFPDDGTGATAGSASPPPEAPPALALSDPLLQAVWAAVPDPVRAAPPGEDAARRARIVAAFEREVARRQRFGALAPMPLRWAAACAPAVGLVLGLVVTTRLTPVAAPFDRVTLAEDAPAAIAELPGAILPESPAATAATPTAAAPEETVLAAPVGPAGRPGTETSGMGEEDQEEDGMVFVASAVSLAELSLEDLGLTESLGEELES
jgi:hypothetical protein